MKKFILPALALAAILLLIGCQTTLKAYQPGDTALLIVLENEQEAGAIPFGSYYAVLTSLSSGRDSDPVRLNPSGDDLYVLEKRLAPGEYYLSQTYFQFTESKKIPDSERKFYEEDFAPLTIAEGTIALCPVIFSTATEKGGGFKMNVVMDLSSYKDKESQKSKDVLKLLKAKFPEDFATWSVQE